MCVGVGGRKGKKLHGVCVYADCRIGTGFSQLCLGSNLAPHQLEPEASVHQWPPVYICGSVLFVHASVITYTHVNTSLGPWSSHLWPSGEFPVS